MDFCYDVFKSYDIRGIYNEEVTLNLAYLLGKAFGSISDGTVIVGHDARISSNALNTMLIKGLLSTGVKVIDIGLVTTPMLYYARELFNKPYAVMITASHCSKEYNGFKLCDNNGTMYEEKIKKLLDIILEGNFKEGTGFIESYDITLDYKKMLFQKINLGPRKLKIVVDCGNGTASYYYPLILNDFGIEVIPLYCNSDPNFPNHIPDPAVESNMYDLENKVKEEKADFGIAFDGDGDRIGIVDENGNLVKTDMFMLIIWKSIYKTCKNKIALIDVKCSNSLKNALEQLNLTVKYNRVGHSYFKKEIKENNYDFAGEFSGHVFFNDDFYGYDDALYAALRLIEIISYSNLNISDYFKDVEKYYSYEDNIPVPNDLKDKIVNKVLHYAKSKNYNIIDIDGVRIEYTNGFALVRKSNTTPCITLRFEAKTKEVMESYKNEIMNIILKGEVVNEK